MSQTHSTKKSRYSHLSPSERGEISAYLKMGKKPAEIARLLGRNRSTITREVQATLDYTPPKCCHCQGRRIKYDFQKPSKIPFIEIGGLPGLIRLKKRRFQCKDYRKVTVSETSLVQKNCQISELVKQKIAQLLLKREALTHIAEKLAISTSTVYRKLKQLQFKDNFSILPEVLS
ncbi:hypothetical protein AU077_09440 [Streptococcus gallolyticus]|nr:hypothetical protein AU077_09440 [Streptococcus gallolyticus]